MAADGVSGGFRHCAQLFYTNKEMKIELQKTFIPHDINLFPDIFLPPAATAVEAHQGHS